MTDWSPPRTPPGRISRVPDLPGLDGLRALAVVAVMLYHANSEWLHGGFLGVEVFFVISGYLITLLLISEYEGSGRVSLRQFWLRRFRRLLPAVFVMLGLLMLYLVIVFPEAQGRTRGDIVGGVGYVSNWYQIAVGAGYTAREAFAPLRHLWSLAVEEQFYLIWPVIMVVVLKRAGLHRMPRVALYLIGATVVITAVVGALYVPGDIDSTCTVGGNGYWTIAGRCISINDALYLGTFTRAGGLMLGAAFAMVWRPLALMRGPMRTKGHLLDAVALAGIGLLGVLMWRIHLAQPALAILTGSRFDPWLFRGGFLLTGLATLMIIAAVTHRQAWLGRVLGNPGFRWVGTRSYGLYLYHWPIYQIIRTQAGVPLTRTEFFLAMAITAVITEASYQLIEMPIRQGRVGEWLRSERRRPSRAVIRRRRRIAGVGLAATIMLGFASVSIAVAPNRCLGVVECSTAEGEAAIEASQATSPPGVVPTSVPAVTEQPIGTEATSGDAEAPTEATVATSTPAGSSPATTTSGESGDAAVADPAAESVPTTAAPTTAAPTTTLPLEQRPVFALGESVMLGAAPQLQAGGFVVNAGVSRQGKDMVTVIGQHRAAGELGQTVVIQSGTNGPVSAETYDAMMALLPADMTPRVVFLTVHADRGWIADNNALIRALPGKYSNVSVLEWDGLVESGTIPGIAGDGIHLGTGAAKQTYANYIFDVIGRRDLVRPVD